MGLGPNILTDLLVSRLSSSGKDGTISAEVRIIIASAMAAMARLNRIWRRNTISFASKFKLYRSLVTCIRLCGCEIWILPDDSEKGIQVFKTGCLRTLLRISYLEHKTNDWVRSKINFLVGPQQPLLTTLKRRNLHGSGISQATTASPKPSFRAPWRVGNSVVGRGKAGRATLKSGHSCPCQSGSQGPSAVPHVPPMNQSVKGLN